MAQAITTEVPMGQFSVFLKSIPNLIISQNLCRLESWNIQILIQTPYFSFLPVFFMSEFMIMTPPMLCSVLVH